MKNFKKIMFGTVLSLTFLACSDQEQLSEVNLVDNSENITKIINSIDTSVKESISNTKLNSQQLGNIFIEESRSKGIRIISLDQNNNYLKSNDSNFTFSNDYIQFSEDLQLNEYSSKEQYKNKLLDLRINVINSEVSILEKQLLIDNIDFMIAFVDWMETLDNENNKSNLKSDCDGWWSCWGQCAAGIIGGAITGAIGGCGVGGAVGAAAGAAIAAIPSAGIAAPVGAGVGAVVGCGAGAVAGVIGGGLTGAAASCD